jgi:TolB-like protein
MTLLRYRLATLPALAVLLLLPLLLLQPALAVGTTLAVLDFELKGKNPAFEGFEEIATESLNAALSKQAGALGVTVLDATTVRQARSQHADMVEAGKVMGARVLVVGRAIVAGSTVMLAARLIDAQTTEQLATAMAKGKAAGPDEAQGLIGELAKSIVGQLPQAIANLKQTEVTAAAAAVAVPVKSAEAVTVEAMGRATVSSRGENARDEALAKALRAAVEQGVGTYVTARTIGENRTALENELFSHAAGFVQRYDILSEQQQGNAFVVRIKAQVGKEPLTDKLSMMGLFRKWRVAVLLVPPNERLFNLQDGEETKLYRAVTNTINNAESSLAQAVVEAGFKTLNPTELDQIRQFVLKMGDPTSNRQAISQEGARVGADILITGKANVNLGSETERKSYGIAVKMVNATCQLQLQAVRVDTGEIITAATFQNDANEGFGDGKDKAVAKAIAAAMRRATPAVLAEVAKLPAGTSLRLQVIASGIGYGDVATLQTALQRVAGVRTVRAEEFKGGSVAFDVEITGDPQSLAGRLAHADPLTALGLKVQSVSRNQIRLAR